MSTKLHHNTTSENVCYHCGEKCIEQRHISDEKSFCCEGCLTVYELLGSGDLCNYYNLEQTPGSKLDPSVSQNYIILDEPKIAEKFILFEDKSVRQISFYIPFIHCSSCIYLLQNLHRLSPHINFSTVNFTTKKVQITYDTEGISLSGLAQLLASVGYAPLITESTDEHIKKRAPRVLEIGVAGFCFGNIMLFSFPEYLGLNLSGNNTWLSFFRYLSFSLSLPVFFYSAREFWRQAWAGIRHKSANISIPVALALIIIFGRSCFEVFSGTGAGYFDSLSGLVFFMLLGRFVQDKTLGALNHDRDFRSYFPMAIQVERAGKMLVETLEEVKSGDILSIAEGEVLPMDGVLLDEQASIDYSFLTGENLPKLIQKNEKLFAGGMNKSKASRYIVSKPFSQSQFASLWQNSVFTEEAQNKNELLDKVSWYFTLIVLILSFVAFGYWYSAGESVKAWDALSTSLIVACPCALLLSATFARGFVMQRLFSKQMYLRSADVLEDLYKVKSVIFDKTGTLTEIDRNSVAYEGKAMNSTQKTLLSSVMSASTHQLAQVLRGLIHVSPHTESTVESVKESEQSIEGWVENHHVEIGTPRYLGVAVKKKSGLEIALLIDKEEIGRFIIKNTYRSEIPKLFKSLINYPLFVLSGDREANKSQLLEELQFSGEAHFDLTAQEKLDFVKELESKTPSMVIGDGVNDAGALKQATVGVALIEDSYSFSPANDVMLPNPKIGNLPQLLKLGSKTRLIIFSTFVYSLVYNSFGLTLALSGNLTPVVAAVLMPASSLGIILLSFLGSRLVTRRL